MSALRLLSRVIALMLLAVSAWAGTTTLRIGMPTSASVINTCVIRSLDSLSMGAYVPTAGVDAVAAGQLSLRCTKGTVAAAIPISGGGQLTGGAASLSYHLYSDSAYQTVWGSATYQYQTIDFCSSTGLLSDASTTSFQNCQTLAHGTAFYYQSTNGVCLYHLGNPQSTTTAAASGVDGSLVLLNGTQQTVLRTAALHGTAWSFYIPAALSTQVGTTGYVYTVPTVATDTSQAISQTSQSVFTPVDLTYYAKVPSGQDVPPGTYVDTVVVQVSF